MKKGEVTNNVLVEIKSIRLANQTNSCNFCTLEFHKSHTEDYSLQISTYRLNIITLRTSRSNIKNYIYNIGETK